MKKLIIIYICLLISLFPLRIINGNSHIEGSKARGTIENQIPTIYLPIETLNQMKEKAPMGCEVASLYAILRQNYQLDISYHQMLDRMPRSKDNPYKGFVGDPYQSLHLKDTIQTIFPKPLEKFGNQYGKVKDISGASINQLERYLKQDYYIIVYVTSKFKKPVFKNYFFGKSVSNLHIMVLNGKSLTGNYHVMDPALGQYWVKKSIFEESYQALKYALIVK